MLLSSLSRSARKIVSHGLSFIIKIMSNMLKGIIEIILFFFKLVQKEFVTNSVLTKLTRLVAVVVTLRMTYEVVRQTLFVHHSQRTE